jgi:formylglycine-generating enzyme required for sulfatase activity
MIAGAVKCHFRTVAVTATLLAAGCVQPSFRGPPAPIASGRWTNSLGMIFCPVPQVSARFSIHETRVADYAAFAAADPGAAGTNWNHARYHGITPVSTGPADPVVNVSWIQANAFCGWLTRTERLKGLLSRDQSYRLPTDDEWSYAVGIGGREIAGTPKQRNGDVPGVYPWGTQFPPPAGAGNFADETARQHFTNWPHIDGYRDGYATTAPVGRFTPNAFGLYDLAGNALEWCADEYDGLSRQRVLRGGAWINCGPRSLLSSYREHAAPERFSVATGFRCVLATNSM